MLPSGVELGVSELVAVVNQTFEYGMADITVHGELANLRVSKGKWVYFDLKDDGASVKFFGTVYMLPGPLEDGMLLKVQATPRLHNLYGFSMNVRSIQLAGEGTIKKAQQLLQAKLTAEGLFDDSRKRPLPRPPSRIGLITSRHSAAYADFIKIINARWGGLEISVINTQVQGEPAPRQIVAAIEQFNAMAQPPEVLVLIRGGGSLDDLAAFSTEQVTRAVAASRVPTLVAIGHEIDESLAELAADLHASTPSNAAELLVPDKTSLLQGLGDIREQLDRSLLQQVTDKQQQLAWASERLDEQWQLLHREARRRLHAQQQLLTAYDPQAPLQRGYALLTDNAGKPITSTGSLALHEAVTITMRGGTAQAEIKEIY